MKRLSPATRAPRYKGGLRHFHRPVARRASWDQWIDGEVRTSSPYKTWLKILAISIAVVALGGIIAGLIVALSRS